MSQSQENWTIYDIAREAGVSAKTVSRVLNGKPGVSSGVRACIIEIMRRVNYHAHIGARGLRGKMRGCIGVTVSAPLETVPISQSFFLWLFVELFRIFGATGEYLCFDMNPYVASFTSGYGRGIWEQLYKACVIAGPLATDDTTIHRIHASGVPYMALGRLSSLPDCSSATVDYEEGAYLSTRFLLRRGHTRIAMLRAFTGFQPGVERLTGYKRALDEAGIPFDENLIRSVSFGASNIANVVHRLLIEPDITALIDCSATEDATALREGSRRAGRVPGKDFEIIAWTYVDNAAVLREAVAHVWLPVREAAAEGLEQLAAWVSGQREGPIRILYRPILSEIVANGEIQRPKRLFDLLA
jgi:LacI family transcriptional regulator